MGNMNGRPKQPKCAGCGRALYKSLESASVKKDWPYAFCRNEKCDFHGDIRETSDMAHSFPTQRSEDQKESDGVATEYEVWRVAMLKLILDPSNRRKDVKQILTARPPQTHSVKSHPPRTLCERCGRVACICNMDEDEPKILKETRARIIEAFSSDGSVHIIGLALAVMSQGIGNNEAANKFIDEYDLTKRYGIKKLEDAKKG